MKLRDFYCTVECPIGRLWAGWFKGTSANIVHKTVTKRAYRATGASRTLRIRVIVSRSNLAAGRGAVA